MDLSVLIVDDEAPARHRLRSMLQQMPQVAVVGEAANVMASLKAIAAHKPQVVLLDIRMPGQSGFDLLPQCQGDHQPVFIFITAFTHHAIRAFEVAAVDYLLKPVAFARLQGALERARSRLRSRDSESRAAEMTLVIEALRQAEEAPAAEARYMTELWVPRRGEHVLLPVDRVDWISAEGDYVRLHVGPDDYLIRETIGGLERGLDPAGFLRVHRSAIVRRARIAAIRQAAFGALKVVLSTGAELPVGRTYASRLRAVRRA
jgi:two-component system, LytTR family, response regulator